MAVSSLEKMLSVLDFIEERGPVRNMEQMLEGLSLTRSTLYRYVRTLTDFGLIATSPGMGYTLGPRIIELDYRIRAQDPLIRAADPLMMQLVQATPGIALLCRRYRDRVLCVHQVRGAVTFTSTYQRGLPRPLLRGAASRVILANMPGPQIARLYQEDPQGFADAEFGESLKAVRSSLRSIRQRGWEASESQWVTGVTGIAAPIFDGGDHVMGSLSVTLPRTAISPAETADIATRVAFCARMVSDTLSAENSGAAWTEDAEPRARTAG